MNELKQKNLTVTDPVCGIELDYAEAAYSSDVGDYIYYFCSQECKKKFDRYTDDYVVRLHELDK